MPSPSESESASSNPQMDITLSVENDLKLMKPPAARLNVAIPGYEVMELIGRGGMGVVFRARQLGLNRIVALKMLSTTAAADEGSLARFRAEGEAVAQLQHANIVQVFDIGENDGLPFFAFEFVDGCNLAQTLHANLPPIREAAEILETLARAVHFAHEHGILHRDLKPGNVMRARDGTLKITDFGLAKFLQQPLRARNQLTQTGEILGTPSYMAPEQASARVEQIGPATDVYGLGVILYELLTGRTPFEGSTVWDTIEQVLKDDPLPPELFRRDLPADLQTICLKCLEKEPARRYTSAAALAEDLRAFLLGEPISARPLTARHRILRWMRRNPGFTLFIGGSGLSLVGLLLGFWWYSPLAVSAIAFAGLLLGAGWYSARLKIALHEVEQQNLRSQRNLERIQLLLETTTRLIAVSDVNELLLLLSETTARMANAERATIFLIDRDNNELWSRVAMGDGVGDIRIPLGQGIAGTVAVSGEPLSLDDPYSDARFNPEVDRRTGYLTRNMLTLPMKRSDGRILGVFQVLNKRNGAFTPEDAAILSALAASAAMAVERE